jgi:endonuclease YncB( thermonuclease family)
MVCLLTAEIAGAQDAVIAGVPGITDADTFTLGAATIRLHGIDAPELGQSCERPGGGSWRFVAVRCRRNRPS